MCQAYLVDGLEADTPGPPPGLALTRQLPARGATTATVVRLNSGWLVKITLFVARAGVKTRVRCTQLDLGRPPQNRSRSQAGMSSRVELVRPPTAVRPRRPTR